MEKFKSVARKDLQGIKFVSNDLRFVAVGEYNPNGFMLDDKKTNYYSLASAIKQNKQGSLWMPNVETGELVLSPFDYFKQHLPIKEEQHEWFNEFGFDLKNPGLSRNLYGSVDRSVKGNFKNYFGKIPRSTELTVDDLFDIASDLKKRFLNIIADGTEKTSHLKIGEQGRADIRKNYSKIEDKM